MVHTLHRDGPVGIWGKQDATINWCEADYAVSPYFAEFVNTTTNSLFFITALFGIWNCYRLGFPLKFWLAHLSMIIVGGGSWLFHMTLQYQFQLLDELPMLYGTAIQLFNIFTLKHTTTSNMYRQSLAIGLIVYCLATTLVYIAIVNPMFHQIAYGLMIAAVVVRCLVLFNVQLVDNYGGKASSKLFPTLNSKSLRSQVFPLLFISGASFLIAFVAWNIDNIYCSDLQIVKDKIGFPWAMILELHGVVWHSLTCYACTTAITLVEWLSCIANNISSPNGRPLALKWFLGFLPFVGILSDAELSTHIASSANKLTIKNGDVNGLSYAQNHSQAVTANGHIKVQ